MSKTVKVYALSTCVHCKQCKEYLDTVGQKYECVYVDRLSGEDRKKAVEDIKKVNPKLSFPTVLVEEEVIIGFDKGELEKLLEK